ncbi:MAG: nucleoside deaminase [Candidatus Dormibacteria bacterium]
MNDEHFLEEAIQLAVDNVHAGVGGPFGAVIVKDGSILARGNNQVTSAHDPTAHAEVQAIRAACSQLGTFQLDGCTLYASCEPCPMCFGAIYWARLDRVVFAARSEDAARYGFDDSHIYNEVRQPLEQRSRAFHQVEHGERLAPFRAWEQLSTRIDY